MDEETDMARGAQEAADPAVRQKQPASYDRDFYTWSQEQGRLVREGRWNEVDRENVAEEIESLGREQFSKLTSALRVLMMHMLKWDYQPERRSRSWAVSIDTQRSEVDDVLVDNPGLKSRIDEAMGRAYYKARNEASNETGLKRSAFPASSPYTFDEVMTRPFPEE